MPDSELERLTVTLVGDVSDYVEKMESAVAATAKADAAWGDDASMRDFEEGMKAAGMTAEELRAKLTEAAEAKQAADAAATRASVAEQWAGDASPASAADEERERHLLELEARAALRVAQRQQAEREALEERIANAAAEVAATEAATQAKMAAQDEENHALEEAARVAAEAREEELAGLALKAQLTVMRRQQAAEAAEAEAVEAQAAMEAAQERAVAEREEADATRQRVEMMRRGEAVMTQMQGPFGRYAERMKDLNFLMRGGAIDQETYQMATAKASEELEKQEQAMERHAKGGANAFGSMRMMTMGMHSLGQMAGVGHHQMMAFTYAIHGLHSAKHIVDALTASMGRLAAMSTGVGIGLAVFAASYALNRIFGGEEEMERVRKTVGGVFIEIATHAKTAKEAIEHADMKNLEKGIEGVIEKMAAWRDASQLSKNWRVLTFQQQLKSPKLPFTLGNEDFDVDREIQNMVRAIENREKLAEAIGKDYRVRNELRQLEQRAGEEMVDKMGKEAKLVGLTSEQHKMAQIVLKEWPKRIQDVALAWITWETGAKAFREANRAANTAMMDAHGVERYKLSLAGVGPTILDVVDKLQKWTEAHKEAGSTLRSLAKSIDDFGISKEEALARKLEAVGDAGTAALVRQMESAQAAMKLYGETRNPIEKFVEEMRKIDKLNADGVLSTDLYTRAVLKAGHALGTLNDKFPSVAYRSAEASALFRSQAQSFVEFNRLVSLARSSDLPTLERGAKSLVPSAIGGGRTAKDLVEEKILTLTELMEKHLKEIAGRAGVPIVPAGLGL